MLFDWLGRRLFQYVHRNYLVYGACWEDPRVDRAALQIGPDDRLLVITSAGCNALDYVLEEPAHIHAVDLNYRQNALLDLKLAAIAELEWPEFFAMFGKGHDPQARRRYRDCLRRRLHQPHRKFWDRHIRLFSGRKPFYHRTTSGWFASWFRFYIDRVLGLKKPLRELFEAENIHQQREIYDRKIRDKLWRPLLRFFLKRDAVLALSGIPPEQRRQIQRFHPNILAYLQSRAEHILYHLPLKENYFWRAYVFGQFTVDCCPRYLEAQHFEQLKSLVKRISFHTDSVQGFLERSSQKFSHFVLLDHMDWLSNERPKELQAEWQAILGRAAPQAKLLWRSLGLETDFVDRVRIRADGKEYLLGDRLQYDRELADELIRKERVNPYGSLHIATLRI